MRSLVRPGKVIAQFAHVIRIGKIDDSNPRIEVGEPRDLVFESVETAVDRLRGLMRAKSAALRAEVADWHLKDRYRERLAFIRDVEHVGPGAHAARTRRHVGGAAGFVDHKRVLARKR